MLRPSIARHELSGISEPPARTHDQDDDSICVLALVPLALLVLVPEAFFVIFAGLLLAILLRAGGHWIAAQLGIATVRRCGVWAWRQASRIVTKAATLLQM